jgi:hypothetical protein
VIALPKPAGAMPSSVCRCDRGRLPLCLLAYRCFLCVGFPFPCVPEVLLYIGTGSWHKAVGIARVIILDSLIGRIPARLLARSVLEPFTCTVSLVLIRSIHCTLAGLIKCTYTSAYTCRLQSPESAHVQAKRIRAKPMYMMMIKI